MIIFNKTARHDRNWESTDAKLVETVHTGSTLKVHNLRNFKWRSSTTCHSEWNDQAYDLSQLCGVDLIVVPIGIRSLCAHTMLRFNFNSSDSLIISIEARKEKGAHYSFGKAFFGKFELFYVFGTETDLLELRTLHRRNQVYALPIKAQPEFIMNLLLNLCQKANQLVEQPQVYSLLNNNCTTCLINAVNHVQPHALNARWQTLFPARIPRLLHKHGLIATDLPYDETMLKCNIPSH